MQRLAPPVLRPADRVKRHWQERLRADTGNLWLCRTMARLFGTAEAASAAA